MGDFLNVGPNIGGRGRDGSLILGQWVFHAPKAIEPVADKHAQCQFIKYNRQDHTRFYYKLGEQEYSVQAIPLNSSTLTLNYQLIKGNNEPLILTLPAIQNLSYTSQQGDISDNKFYVDAQVGRTYQLTLSIKETK